MKRVLSLLLVLIFILTGSFTGCSKKDDSASANTKDIIDYDYGGQTSEANTQSLAPDTIITDNASNSSTSYDTGEASQSTAKSDEAYGAAGVTADMASANNTEEYTDITEAGFKDTLTNPLSTFAIDVDTASYTNLRKNLNNGIIPEPGSIRIEEMLNYFSYDYDEPKGNVPFTINTEIGICPWNEENYLLMVGIQGKHVDKSKLPKSNLVFLIDVSGSMDEPDKLPLLKSAFSNLVEVLGENDKISIVVYAGDSGVVLDSVRGNNKDIILDAIDDLSAGGSTGGAGGIDLAYKLAEKNYIKGGNNRIILATDGDFNVGPSSVEELEDIISEKRESGIFLSVLGFGSGNIKDNKMETLADKGNGNYSYIDSVKEAKRVLVDEMAETLLTIAKDVKIQLEFNPYHVSGYRLIGYEDRALANEDFKNDTVDAGELGAGHTVTAVYEIVPAGVNSSDGDLKYQINTDRNSEYPNEISEIRLRYKEPDGEDSKEIKQVVSFQNTPTDKKKYSEDFYFAAAVVELGMILRGSDYLGTSTLSSVMDLAAKGVGDDEGDYRMEFVNMVDYYRELSGYQW